MEKLSLSEIIEEVHLNQERGFYVEFRSSQGKPTGLYIGREPNGSD